MEGRDEVQRGEGQAFGREDTELKTQDGSAETSGGRIEAYGMQTELETVDPFQSLRTVLSPLA